MLHETTLKNDQTALLIGVYTSTADRATCDDNLGELGRLCETYGLKPLSLISCPMRKINAGMFLGKGKLDELLLQAETQRVDVIVFDEELTPHQQRNLEKWFQRPVIDRTELIIEVFAKRAQTREARLQVELARVQYLLPRLKRMWTHLSRQAGSGGGGGGGYLRGEGELQIELDRRILRKRIVQLQKEIASVQEHRTVQRRQRERGAIPTFAIVGYTNAGKSTLLRVLTQAAVLVEDKLFATLDTTTRRYTLPNKQQVLLVDTVGFIQKIPHSVVAAFKGTLEEAIHTDILLHLIDASHPMAELQAKATLTVLRELRATAPIITLLNKIDKCSPDDPIVQTLKSNYQQAIPISAVTQEGLDQLVSLMMQNISSVRKTVWLKVPQGDYSLVAELMREGRVLKCDYEESDVVLHVEVPTRLEFKIRPFIYEL